MGRPGEETRRASQPATWTDVMPSGRTHAKATLILTAAATAAAPLYASFLGWESLALIPGCLVGLVVHPDHDTNYGTYSLRLIYDRLGALPALMWTMIWRPYGLLVRHRSVISHSLIFGTVLRLLYLGVIFGALASPLLALFLLAGYGEILGRVFFAAFTWPGSWYAFWGLVLADGLHLLMDWIGGWRL